MKNGLILYFLQKMKVWDPHRLMDGTDLKNLCMVRVDD